MEAGLSALRFNFRGVGKSTGSYDEGSGEREDAASALDWLDYRYPALPLALIGFSFGSWVGLDVGCRDHRVRALVGLGLPLNYYDFDFLVENPRPALFLAGTEDEFCPRDRMERLARRLPPASRFHWVPGADHFFVGRLEQMQEYITSFFRGIDFQPRGQ